MIALEEGVKRRVKRNRWGQRENRRGGGKEVVAVDSLVSAVFVTFCRVRKYKKVIKI